MSNQNSGSGSSTPFKPTRPEAVLTASFAVATGTVTMAINQSIVAGIAVSGLTFLVFLDVIATTTQLSSIG